MIFFGGWRNRLENALKWQSSKLLRCYQSTVLGGRYAPTVRDCEELWPSLKQCFGARRRKRI